MQAVCGAIGTILFFVLEWIQSQVLLNKIMTVCCEL